MKTLFKLFFVMFLASSAFGQGATCQSGYVCNGAETTNGDAVILYPPQDAATVVVNISGTWSGTISFKGSNGGVYVANTCTSQSAATTATTTTANDQWRCPVAGLTSFEAVSTASMTGSATVTVTASKGSPSLGGGGGSGTGFPVTATVQVTSPGEINFATGSTLNLASGSTFSCAGTGCPAKTDLSNLASPTAMPAGQQLNSFQMAAGSTLSPGSGTVNANQINGGVVPPSANVLGTNSQGQLVAGGLAGAIYAFDYGVLANGQSVDDASWGASNTETGSGSGSSLNLTAFPTALTNPSLIMIGVLAQTAQFPITITDTAGNTYVDCGPTSFVTVTGYKAECFYAENTHTTASNVVHAAFNAGGFADVEAAEVLNVATSSPVDGGVNVGYASAGTQTGGSIAANNLAGPSITTVTNGDLLFAFNQGSTGSTSPGLGWTPLTTSPAQYQVQATAGLVRSYFTSTASGISFGQFIVAFKPAGTGNIGMTTTVTTTSGDPVFAGGDVGKKAFGNSNCANSGAAPCPLAIPATTIITYNSAHSATVNAPATAATSGNGFFQWGSGSNASPGGIGTDDSVSLVNAEAAALATPGGTLILPCGQMMISEGVFRVLTPHQQAAMTIDGCAEGYGPSVLVPTPDFNFTGIANSTGIIYYDTYSGGENNIFGADDYLSSIQINAIGTVNTYGPNTYAFVMGPQFTGRTLWVTGGTAPVNMAAGISSQGSVALIESGTAFDAYPGSGVGLAVTANNFNDGTSLSENCYLNGLSATGGTLTSTGTDWANSAMTIAGANATFVGDSVVTTSTDLTVSSGSLSMQGGVVTDGTILIVSGGAVSLCGTQVSSGTAPSISSGSLNVSCGSKISGAASSIIQSGGTVTVTGSTLAGSVGQSAGTFSATNTTFAVGTSNFGGVALTGTAVAKLASSGLTGTAGSPVRLISGTPLLYDLGGNIPNSAPVVTVGNIVGGNPSATGTALATGALVLSGNWGTSAATSAWQGFNSPVTFTVTNGSASVGASPTIAYTFPTPYWQTPLWCNATQVGGTNTVGTLSSSSLSATGVTFTYSLIPVVNDTEFIQVQCAVQ